MKKNKKKKWLCVSIETHKIIEKIAQNEGKFMERALTDLVIDALKFREQEAVKK